MATTRAYFLRAGGWRTRVYEAGSDDKPVLMLIHDGAFGTDAPLCWGDVMDRLADDYHVFAPDLLGWGGSDKVCFFDRSPYDFRLEHVASLCEVLALDEPIHFAGTSFGAEIVVRAAAEDRWGWPVRSAVAITGTGGRLYRVPGAIEQLSDYEPSLEAAEHLTGLLVETTEGLEDHVERRYENSLIPGHWEALAALRVRNPAVERQASADDWPDPLKTCQVPILYVEGRDDEVLESGWAQKMADLTPEGQSLVIDGAHEPNLNHPDVVAEAMRDFLGSVR